MRDGYSTGHVGVKSNRKGASMISIPSANYFCTSRTPKKFLPPIPRISIPPYRIHLFIHLPEPGRLSTQLPAAFAYNFVTHPTTESLLNESRSSRRRCYFCFLTFTNIAVVLHLSLLSQSLCHHFLAIINITVASLAKVHVFFCRYRGLGCFRSCIAILI